MYTPALLLFLSLAIAGRSQTRVGAAAHPLNSSLVERSNVIYSSQGDATYYYDITGTGPCGAYQPGAVTQYSETQGYGKCEGPLTGPLLKTLMQRGSNKVVAMGGLEWEFCGKRVKAYVGDMVVDDLILWDNCADCRGGLDFSSTQFHDIYGSSGCEQGRVPGGVRFEITDDQVWEQYTADGSTLLPSFLDKHSGCKVAEKGVTKCSEDRKSTIICTEDHRDGSRYQGLLNWIPTECSAGLTCRMTTNDASGYGYCG